jgi:SAM-dependent methyltransferase
MTTLSDLPATAPLLAPPDDFAATFRDEFAAFRAMAARSPRGGGGLSVRWDDAKPCPDDRTATTGFDRHYVYHTAWAARVIARTRPARHVDVSSSLYFAAIASAFVPVDYYEYRPVRLDLDNLETNTADLLKLPFADASVASISCMHVVEHVGLGRYGDPLDAEGDLAAMNELKRVVAPGGDLLFVVPVGRPRVVFNAHRIYGPGHVLDAFAGMKLEEFALIPDGRFGRGLVIDPKPAFVDEQNYGCGCFWFRRPA